MNKLMKHGLLMGIVVMLVIGTLLTSCAPQPTGPIKLRYSGHMPPKNPVSLQQLRFAEEVGKRTEFDVTIETYIAGELYKSEDVVDAVNAGAIEMGYGSTGLSFSPRNPVFAYDANFFLLQSIEHFQRAKDELAKVMFPLFEEQNVKVIHWVPYSGLAFATKKPVVNPEDIKGMMIRGPGAMIATLEFLGAVPASMASSEVYDAVAKGALDGAVAGWSTFYSRKWYEVTDYFTGPVKSASWVSFMNLDTWNGLPKDVQNMLMEVGKEIEEWSFEQAIAFDKESIEFLRTEGTVTILSAEQTAAWEEAVLPTYDIWVEECEKAGYGSQAREIIEILEKTK